MYCCVHCREAFSLPASGLHNDLLGRATSADGCPCEGRVMLQEPGQGRTTDIYSTEYTKDEYPSNLSAAEGNFGLQGSSKQTEDQCAPSQQPESKVAGVYSVILRPVRVLGMPGIQLPHRQLALTRTSTSVQ
ncbi:hypothetical protein V8C34DRAFT_270399 [Trichoderma compactum]